MSFSIHFKKKLWLLFILIVNSSTINSQKAIINGTVRDGEDLEFLIGVNIQSQDQIGTITDFNGRYSLELPSGEHTLIFKYIGYKIFWVGKGFYVEIFDFLEISHNYDHITFKSQSSKSHIF